MDLSIHLRGGNSHVFNQRTNGRVGGCVSVIAEKFRTRFVKENVKHIFVRNDKPPRLTIVDRRSHRAMLQDFAYSLMVNHRRSSEIDWNRKAPNSQNSKC